MKYVELRKLAEDASPGPWHIGPFVAVDTGIWSHGTWPIATTQVDSAAEGLTSTVERKTLDAAYVAAASPDVILALLDERERLRDLIYRWKDVYERGFLTSDFQPLYDETFNMLDGRPVEAAP